MSISKYGDAEIRTALAEFGLAADAPLVGQIRTYAELLDRWGQRINLTALRSPREVLRRHFGESVFGTQFIGDGATTLLDAGSGAGFPGLPIKMFRPSLRATLVEPNTKKAAFLAEVIRALSLEGANVICARIEDLPSSRPLDCITARAVGRFESLLDCASRLLRAGGRVVLWVGRADASAIQRIPRWDWHPDVPVPRSKERVILVGELPS